MPLRTRITLVLALWIACELVAFTLVANWIGLGGAILLGFATSLVGAALLKRVGTSALTRLRRGVGPGGFGVIQGDLALDQTLAGLGAVLLLLPGFVTDAVGLLLTIPALRDTTGGWLRRLGARVTRGGPGPQHGPTTIDLAPEDWRIVEETRRGPVPKA